jgi:hypothetical protein
VFTYTFLLKLAVSAFIIFHLTLIVCWMFPNHPIEHELTTIFRPYIGFLAMHQDYSVFAPNPRTVNVHLEAMVTYIDGTSRIWQFPRVERMNLWQKMFKERYRKFGADNLAWTTNIKLLQDLARYVARITSSASHRAAMVTIYRYDAGIPPPPIGFNESPPPQADVQTILTYAVQDEDLE